MNSFKKIIFETVIIVILTFFGWLIGGMHNQVYTQIPEKYIDKDRFNDVCERLDRIEDKVDDLNLYLRARAP